MIGYEGTGEEPAGFLARTGAVGGVLWDRNPGRTASTVWAGAFEVASGGVRRTAGETGVVRRVVRAGARSGTKTTAATANSGDCVWGSPGFLHKTSFCHPPS